MTKLKTIIYAVCVLSGTIIGVGMFSLPYLTLQVGWISIIAYFLIIGSLVALVHVFFGELVLRTPDGMRLPGIAEYYWGKSGKRLTMVTHIFSLFGALLAYIIVGGGFLRELLSSSGYDINLSIAISAYALAGGFIMLLGTSALNKLQLVGIIGFFSVIVSIAWLGKADISLANVLARNGDSVSWFAPYGIVMFSLWGAALIPQIEDILGKHGKYMTKVIVASMALPALIYFFFIFTILGIVGEGTNPSALISLGSVLGQSAEKLILLFGLITTFTSFVAIGLTLAQVIELDLKVKKLISWMTVLIIPLFLYFAGINDFLAVIVFLGAVFLAIDGINILLMYRKGVPQAAEWKRKISILLIIMMLGGIIYEIGSLLAK